MSCSQLLVHCPCLLLSLPCPAPPPAFISPNFVTHARSHPATLSLDHKANPTVRSDSLVIVGAGSSSKAFKCCLLGLLMLGLRETVRAATGLEIYLAL